MLKMDWRKRMGKETKNKRMQKPNKKIIIRRTKDHQRKRKDRKLIKD